MSAAETLTRIVALVAELNLREEAGAPALSYDELARTHGVTRRQIEQDIRTLTLLGESADSDWLLSLHVMLDEHGVRITSSGPFRRPIRLRPEEMLAVQMALVAEGQVELAAKIGGEAAARDAGRAAPQHSSIADAVSAAIADQRRVRCRYAADRRGAPSERTIQPHQAVEFRNRVYIVAWCEASGGWRNFRLDRILEATHDGGFEPRADFVPLRATSEVFRPGQVEEVVVRYRDGAARWARERYPGSEDGGNGSVLTRFQVANPEWLIRLVLEVGADAEVVEPEDYRHAMRIAVA